MSSLLCPLRLLAPARGPTEHPFFWKKNTDCVNEGAGPSVEFCIALHAASPRSALSIGKK